MKVVKVLIVGLILVSSVLAMQPPQQPSQQPDDEQSDDDQQKFDLEIQRIVNSNDTSEIVFEDLKVVRHNKTAYVARGQFTTTIDFDDEWQVETFCWRSKLGNNQWELTAFKAHLQKVSDFIDNVYVKHLQESLRPFSNLPVYGEDTPKILPKATYTIKDYVGDVRDFPPNLRDGTYRIEVFLSDMAGVVKAGVVLYFKVYPEIG